MSKRANFSQYFNVNYKKYFYCIDNQVDPLIKLSAEQKIEQLIKKHSGEENAEYISQKVINKMGEDYFRLAGLPFSIKERNNIFKSNMKIFEANQEKYRVAVEKLEKFNTGELKMSKKEKDELAE